MRDRCVVISVAWDLTDVDLLFIPTDIHTFLLTAELSDAQDPGVWARQSIS